MARPPDDATGPRRRLTSSEASSTSSVLDQDTASIPTGNKRGGEPRHIADVLADALAALLSGAQ